MKNIILFSIFVALMTAGFQLAEVTQLTPTSLASQGSPQIVKAELPPDYFSDQVAPILDKRCTVCHSCMDSPCQLKLGSFEGISRGTHPEPILGSTKRTKPIRLIDEPNVQAWRARNYSPVVPESGNQESAAERLQNSILFQAITLGRANANLANDPVKAGRAFEDIQNYYRARRWSCPTTQSDFKRFATNNPHLGMPLGLPPLSDKEYQILTKWIQAGAQGPSEARRSAEAKASNQNVIIKWESFLNSEDARRQLVARYLYEHLSFVKFYFKEMPKLEFYELVRSRTPTGSAISEIVTETPHTFPGSHTRVYYRLRKFTEKPVLKNHIVFEVGPEKLAKLENLFFGKTQWALPAQFVQTYSKNPFKDFEAIPAEARSLFMLTHSKVLVDQMTRGSVCTETGGTYAIRDHFWVMFLDPAADPSVQDPSLGGSGALTISSFRQENYQNAFEQSLRHIRPGGLSLGDIWSGDQGDATNARLTVFRHEATASVYNDWIGGPAPTAWVLSYSNFERMFYNLVVNYKIWSTLVHKGVTWANMSEIRKEGEELFVSLLPVDYRNKVRGQWTRGLQSGAYNSYAERSDGRASQISIRNPSRPYADLISQLEEKFQISRPRRGDDLNYRRRGQPETVPSEFNSLKDFEDAIRLLTQRRDLKFPRFMPAITYVRAKDPQTNRMQVYSLINHRAYSGNENIYFQAASRRGGEDYFSAFRGIYGSHPHLFFDLSRNNARQFLTSLLNVSSAEDMMSLQANFGVGRLNSKFWDFYDSLIRYHQQVDPVNAGIIDLNGYQNNRGYE